MGYLTPAPPMWWEVTTTNTIPLGRDPAAWSCPWCRTLHPEDEYGCPNCGAPRMVQAAPTRRDAPRRPVVTYISSDRK